MSAVSGRVPVPVCLHGGLIAWLVLVAALVAPPIALAQAPDGYVSAYIPPTVRARDELVEIRRNGEVLSLRDLPRFVLAGDRIRLKRSDASVVLAMGDGSSIVVRWSLEPYVVPIVKRRFDWDRLFNRPPSKRRPIEAITTKMDFEPLDLPTDPFKVQYISRLPYVGATLSMFPQDPSITHDSVRIFAPSFDGFSSTSETIWQTGREPVLLVAGEDNHIAWTNGVEPFEFQLTTSNGVSVKVPKVQRGPVSTASVNIDGRWLKPGWAMVYVKDANSATFGSYALTVDAAEIAKCPFVSTVSPLTIDSAVVCSTWRQHDGRTHAPPK